MVSEDGCPFSDSVLAGLSKAELKRWRREQELLNLAIGIIAEGGSGALTLEKLTAISPYSKGTIYNHFCSREDCMSALGARAISMTLTLLHRADEFEGHLREKMLAMHYAYQLFARLQPTLFLIVLSCKAPGVREKSSPERNETLDRLEKEIEAFCDSLLIQAIDEGTLKMPDGMTTEDLTFATWAVSFGTNALSTMARDVHSIKRLDSGGLVYNNINLLLDGMRWQPLSSDWNYHDTWKRVENEIFSCDIKSCSDSAAGKNESDL